MYVKLLDRNLNPVSCPSIPEELVLIKLPSRHSSCLSIPQRLVLIKLPLSQGVQYFCVVVIITIIIYERERERFSISSFCKSLVAHNKIGIQ